MKTIICIVTFVLSLVGIASAQERAPIFDLDQPGSPVNINNLSCGKYIDLVHSHDPSSYDVIIWIHGFLSAIDNKYTPLDRAFAAGVFYAIESGCTDKTTPLVNALAAGQKALAKK